MGKPALVAMLLCLVGLVSTACGTAAAAHPTTHTLAIRNFAFAPALLTVHVGDTLVWTNHDKAQHTVTSKQSSPVQLGSPTLNTAGTYHVTFTHAGVVQYYCAFHPFMTATVTVRRA